MGACVSQMTINVKELFRSFFDSLSFVRRTVGTLPKTAIVAMSLTNASAAGRHQSHLQLTRARCDYALML